MGYQATPTPDMGRFSIETRSESFYLFLPGVISYPAGENRVTLEPLYSDIDALIAALEQARRMHRDGDPYEWVDAEGSPVHVVHRPDTIKVECSDADKVLLLEQTALVGRTNALSNLAAHGELASDEARVLLEALTKHSFASADLLKDAIETSERQYQDALIACGVRGA